MQTRQFDVSLYDYVSNLYLCRSQCHYNRALQGFADTGLTQLFPEDLSEISDKLRFDQQQQLNTSSV